MTINMNHATTGGENAEVRLHDKKQQVAAITPQALPTTCSKSPAGFLVVHDGHLGTG